MKTYCQNIESFFVCLFRVFVSSVLVVSTFPLFRTAGYFSPPVILSTHTVCNSGKDVGNRNRDREIGNHNSGRDVGNHNSGRDVGNRNNGRDVGNRNNGRDVGNHNSGRDVGNRNNGRDVGNHNSGRDVGNRNNGRDVGNRNNGRDVGNRNNGRDVGNFNNGRDVGKRNNGPDVGNRNNGPDVGNRNSSRLCGALVHIMMKISSAGLVSVHQTRKRPAVLHGVFSQKCCFKFSSDVSWCKPLTPSRNITTVKSHPESPIYQTQNRGW